MSNAGMSEKMYLHILNNMHKLDIDLKDGIITTARGTNGTLCSSTGYLRIKLAGKLCQAHQILAVCYFKEKCIGMQINHKDGNKLKNNEENLEIMTQIENIKHEWENGLCNMEHKRKLADEQVKYIRENYIPYKKKGFGSRKYFCEKFNVGKGVIDRVISRTGYEWVE